MAGIIDIHTHLACEDWVALLASDGGPHFGLIEKEGRRLITTGGKVFAPILPDLLRFEGRVAEMDAAGVDIAVLSVTAPGVTWGTREVAARAARIANDHLAACTAEAPDRFRWLAALPMHEPDLALEELDRCLRAGAIGVAMMGNVLGQPLTDPAFAGVWDRLNADRTVVLLHPTIPAGAPQMGLDDYHLMGLLGLMFDSSAAVARMIFAGFFDRYPDLRLVMPHSGAVLPALSSRLDHGWRIFPRCSDTLSEPPTRVLSRIWYDNANSSPETIAICAGFAGEGHMLHGSDYPFVPMEKSVQALDRVPGPLGQAMRRDNALALLGG